MTTEVKTAIATALAGKEVTLIQNGWSNIHDEPVIATNVHTGCQSYLLSTTDSGANKKTAEYCAELA